MVRLIGISHHRFKFHRDNVFAQRETASVGFGDIRAYTPTGPLAVSRCDVKFTEPPR